VDCTARRSDVVLTGRKRDRGTCSPTAEPVKNFTAAPVYNSNSSSNSSSNNSSNNNNKDNNTNNKWTENKKR
jgi:hypothetical protein